MATIGDRPFSKNYSGLINQSVLAVAIFVVCITSHELMKRKRRGRHDGEGLGSVESWQFGYLFQGRSWARKPSPPIAQGWPLAWVPQAIGFPEARFTKLRGVDASVYVRFLKGCVIFALIHTLTTFPILFPIHITFAGDTVSPKSMTRASISSLVNTTKGVSLLWIHILLLVWVTVTWVASLCWICRDTFRYRALKIEDSIDRAARETTAPKDSQHYPHPHPQYPFQALPPEGRDGANRGIRVRTVMVTNIPAGLRSEKDLKEYFEYYLSRPLTKPALPVTSAVQPGLLDRTLGFMYNRGMHFATRVYETRIKTGDVSSPDPEDRKDSVEAPVIEKVVLVRKMSDLAQLLERREEVLRLLETAHIKLARSALGAVSEAMGAVSKRAMIRSAASRMSIGLGLRSSPAESLDIERGAGTEEGLGEDRMDLLVRTLAPFVEPMDQSRRPGPTSRFLQWALRAEPAIELRSPQSDASQKSPAAPEHGTIWDALLSLPRSTLDAYQPLIRLNALFIGKTVPAIDYYTAKLNIVNSLITEQRAQLPADFPPMSTAFVTFADPQDAKRACKYLAGHPNNPLNACLVSMAPSYDDLDWTRLMKSTYRAEFVKDWVVNVGVWGFTIFWVFPVTSIVGLVSIQNISAFWPGLKRYLDKHAWQSEVLQSFLPTVLVAILTLLIPPVLLLIAKKAHTITTLSALHDRILTRYYKFLIVNVLVFFCVGTAALQSFLVSFKAASGHQILTDISDSFPTAGPFYVGWLIFTMAMHGGVELALFGLPLILYPSTKRQVTPRKRAVGIRPRTFNFYYWLPNHLLVVHILMLFAVLNPLVLPFGLVYFCVESVVVKNQLLHVYARNYEGDGKTLLIRVIRYSSDGLILAQAVFLAYMVVLKVKANVAVAAVLIILTVLFKISLTRFCRAKFERDDLKEAKILCGTSPTEDKPRAAYAEELSDSPEMIDQHETSNTHPERQSRLKYWTWKFSSRVGFSYAATLPRGHHDQRRKANPFQPRSSADSAMPLHPCASTSTAGLLKVSSDPEPVLNEITHEEIRESPSETPDEQVSNGFYDSHALVSPHPRHPTWDDEPSPDTPYVNPYYTLAISDTLWLPRDPLGLLNLDDTVDLRISITSEPGTGRLGPWPEDEFIASALTSVFVHSFGSVDDDSASAHPSATSARQLTGSEVIVLPAGIASRVESIGVEEVMEATSPRLPSLLGRPRSNTTGTLSVSLRRQTSGQDEPTSGFRSFSLQSDTSVQSPPSRLTSPSPRDRSTSMSALGLGVPPDRRTPQEPTPTSIRSQGQTNSLPRSPGTGSVISTREALVGEAIAEEQVAAVERSRLEDAERKRARESRSWLTAWMYSSAG